MATEDTIMTAAEYSESVYQWLQQAHQWQALAVGKSGGHWNSCLFLKMSNYFISAIVYTP